MGSSPFTRTRGLLHIEAVLFLFIRTDYTEDNPDIDGIISYLNEEEPKEFK